MTLWIATVNYDMIQNYQSLAVSNVHPFFNDIVTEAVDPVLASGFVTAVAGATAVDSSLRYIDIIFSRLYLPGLLFDCFVSDFGINYGTWNDPRTGNGYFSNRRNWRIWRIGKKQQQQKMVIIS